MTIHPERRRLLSRSIDRGVEMRIHTTGVVAVTGAILLLTFGAAPATAASGGGSVGYCSSMRVEPLDHVRAGGRGTLMERRH